MTTLYSDGDVIHVTAPTGGYTAGALVALTDMVGIVHETAAAGVTAVLQVRGVHTLTKPAAADAGFTAGDTVYVTATGALSNAATGKTYVGKAWAAAVTGATSMQVHINFGSNPA